MISGTGLWRWAAVSNERAVANARAAAVECSRRRVERAEVAAYLEALRERPAVEAAVREAVRAR
jgi:hypothetical protein